MQLYEDWLKYQFEICPCCGKPKKPQIGAKIHREGDIVLDPMAGSGTILVACSLGRNVIAVELESKFIDIMKGNWEKIKQRGAQLGYTFGQAQIICGDARQLEGLLVDKIVTSPPYASGGTKADENPENYIRREEARLKLFPMRPKTFVGRYSGDRDNIGNLPYGQIDKIVTSPPYAEQVQGSRHSDHQPEQRKKRLIKAGYNPDDYQLGKGRQCEVVWEYGKAEGQLGNLPYGNIDSIITSPPYEGSVTQGGDTDAHKAKYGYQGENIGYTEDKSNIGNLKSQSYLEAMALVYRQCYKVLRDGGLCILVVKNFIRNQKEVDLKADTIKLCEQAGLSFIEEHHRILPSQSFWRTIYAQRYPLAPVIDREFVLVFRRDE